MRRKTLMWPWCLGVRGQGCQKGLWRVWEHLKAGKRQAECQEKAINVTFWRAGSGVPKRAFGGFWRVWRLARMPRKSFWCGLGALACGVRGAKRAFGGFWRVWRLANGRLECQEKAIDVALVPWPAGSGVPAKSVFEGFGGCLGLQGQGCQNGLWRVLECLERLKAGKRQAWTPWKSYWCRLECQEKAIDVALVPWPATKETSSTPPVVPGAAPASAKAGVGGHTYLRAYIHIYSFITSSLSHCFRTFRKAWWRWSSLAKPWWRTTNRRGRRWSHFCGWLLIQRDKGMLHLTWRAGSPKAVLNGVISRKELLGHYVLVMVCLKERATKIHWS